MKEFTTRHDRDGTPVKEGDILQYYRDGNIPAYKPYKTVRWTQSFNYTGWNIGDCSNYKIVGNIHDKLENYLDTRQTAQEFELSRELQIERIMYGEE